MGHWKGGNARTVRVNCNIEPRPNGITIIPVESSEGIVFLVEVLPSQAPPHQASDHLYYQRYNFQNLPMKHYQIADSFGKRMKPNLELGIRYLGDLNSTGYEFEFIVFNNSTVTAHHVGLILNIQAHFSLDENQASFTKLKHGDYQREPFNTLGFAFDTIYPYFSSSTFMKTTNRFPGGIPVAFKGTIVADDFITDFNFTWYTGFPGEITVKYDKKRDS